MGVGDPAPDPEQKRRRPPEGGEMPEEAGRAESKTQEEKTRVKDGGALGFSPSAVGFTALRFLVIL